LLFLQGEPPNLLFARPIGLSLHKEKGDQTIFLVIDEVYALDLEPIGAGQGLDPLHYVGAWPNKLEVGLASAVAELNERVDEEVVLDTVNELCLRIAAQRRCPVLLNIEDIVAFINNA